MTRPKAIFFDMRGALTDSQALDPQHTARISALCAERFGGSPNQWAEANRDLAAELDCRGADGARRPPGGSTCALS